MDSIDARSPLGALITPKRLGAASVVFLLLAMLALVMWPLESAGTVLLGLVLVIAAVGVLLSLIDITTHRLPRVLVLPLYPIVSMFLLVDARLGGVGGWSGAAWGIIIWGCVLGGLWVLSSARAMGMGDVTLAPPLGAALGWYGADIAFAGLMMAFVTGALVAVILISLGRADRRSHVPFGPMLFAGWYAGMLLGALP